MSKIFLIVLRKIIARGFQNLRLLSKLLSFWAILRAEPLATRLLIKNNVYGFHHVKTVKLIKLPEIFKNSKYSKFVLRTLQIYRRPLCIYKISKPRNIYNMKTFVKVYQSSNINKLLLLWSIYRCLCSCLFFTMLSKPGNF